MAEKINIDDIEEGMIVAKSVVNKYDQMLIKQDTNLQEKHKKILKMWGVEEIHVRTEEDEVSEENIKDNKSKAEELLKDYIFWNPENANERDLYNLALYEQSLKLLRKQI